MKYKITALMLVLLLLASPAVFAKKGPADTIARQRPTVDQVATDEKSHDIGQLHFTVSNWGFFGSQRGDDNPNYCIIYTDGENAGTCRPSAEYPGGSGIEYLFQGALWIGAVVSGDTMVSTGEDGWFHNINEIFPGYNQATDTIMHRSILTGDPDAISEQDFIAIMTDTVKNPDFVPSDHRPIGVKVEQRSVSWSYNYARNFIIIDYWITNIRQDEATIRDVYIGIYIDGDVGHVDKPNYAQDDITGFLKFVIDDITGQTSWVNTAWLADNDGDPTSDGRFDEYSPTGALGVAVLRVGNENLDSLNYSFNWWVSNTNEDLDWGPYLREYAPWGWDGTPETDKAKYQVMSSHEFDYDQTEIANHASYPDYMTPPSEPFDLAEMLRGGYDTRFLFSFGPFTLEYGQTIPVGIAVMVAEDFHIDPRNVGMSPNGGSIPSGWDASKFQFDQVGRSTEWVRTVYGFEPPDDPKYQGPVPPPRPPFFVETYDNKIEILWDPDTCMEFFDEITNLYDFAGFRIYVGEANLNRYYTPIVEYDKVLFRDYHYDYGFETDVRVECIRARTDSDSIIHDEVLDWSFCLDTIVVWDGGVPRDSIFQRVPYGTNTGLPKDSVLIGGKWHYRHTLTHQRAGGDLYIAMTAYDYGQPSRDLESLESSKTTNYLWVVPRGTLDDSGDGHEVYVTPNPYRIDHEYSGRHGLDWETPVGRVWTEYSRKIRFNNLPAKCIIRIYTLDGDLVQEIEHVDPMVGMTKDEMIGAHDWDLINRNDQAIASGIYMFSVENTDNGEYQLGKFVIIK